MLRFQSYSKKTNHIIILMLLVANNSKRPVYCKLNMFHLQDECYKEQIIAILKEIQCICRDLLEPDLM